MQSKIRGVKDPTDYRRWHRWFAWYPVRAFVSPELVWEANKAHKTHHRPPWCWVWLGYIERKFDTDNYVEGYWVKRITEETK